ncbi:MAG TPA: hypothetical protein VHP38_00025 [Ruminiclostridium sp.]|nr:hypothetical protein [Ruminiclostridium sp.]
MSDLVKMSSTIVAAAASARAAQAIMSTGTDPMAIKEFSFEVNITADTDFKSETEISLDIWRISLKEKLTYEYKEHFGITVKCTMVPVYTLTK